MKKILIFFALIAILSVSLFATNDNTLSHNKEVTIIFPEETTLTKAEQERITQYLLTGEQPLSRNIICDLLGHNMSLSGTGLKVISHRVRSTNPRCLEETYDVYTCSRCSHISSTLIGRSPMSCCP